MGKEVSRDEDPDVSAVLPSLQVFKHN